MMLPKLSGQEGDPVPAVLTLQQHFIDISFSQRGQGPLPDLKT